MQSSQKACDLMNITECGTFLWKGRMIKEADSKFHHFFYYNKSQFLCTLLCLSINQR